jgi:hypothetical protein
MQCARRQNSLRPELVPRSLGTIGTNLTLSENMVPGTCLTTADPPYPAGDIDLRVVYRESATFRDPTTTLQRSKIQGGWA